MAEKSKSQSSLNKTSTNLQLKKQEMKKRKREITTYETKNGSKRLVTLTLPYRQAL